MDANLIDRLIECSQRKTTVYFSGSNLDIVFQTQVLSVSNDQIALRNKVPPDYIHQVTSSEEFYVQFGMARFIANAIQTDYENIIFPIKDLIQVDETREGERFAFEQEESVVCELLNPYDKTTILSKSVMDMSAAGLSIRTNKPSKLFMPNTYFESMQIKIDGEIYKRASGRVVYSRKLLDLRGRLRVQVGFKIDSFDK